VTRASAQPSPFRRDGLLRRAAPFLVAMAISFAAIRLPAVKRDAAELIEAGVLSLILIGVVLALPWHHLPRTADLVPPLAYMVVVALLADGVGGAVSAYSTLLLLPVLCSRCTARACSSRSASSALGSCSPCPCC
jgi:peptidoglycan/LPS O-acetylase OafA/YrhL